MKTLDKIGLIVFSNFMLIISIIVCLLIFGWLDLDSVHYVVKYALSDTFTTNVFLALCIVFILLALKCIFFTSEEKKINGIKDGILLKNDDGQLVISKSTLEELVKNITNGFESVQNPVSRVVLDEEKRVVVFVTLSVTENAVIKELSTNLQNKIKTAIKKTSDLEVKEVNISVRNLQPEENKTI